MLMIKHSILSYPCIAGRVTSYHLLIFSPVIAVIGITGISFSGKQTMNLITFNSVYLNLHMMKHPPNTFSFEFHLNIRINVSIVCTDSNANTYSFILSISFRRKYVILLIIAIRLCEKMFLILFLNYTCFSFVYPPSAMDSDTCLYHVQDIIVPI